MTPSAVCPELKRAIALSGTIVSWAVLTDVPADALECPLAAIELSARLRAESAATLAALLDDEVVVLAFAPVVPGTASANGVAVGALGALVAVVADAALTTSGLPVVSVVSVVAALLADGVTWVGTALPPGVVTAPTVAAGAAGFDVPPA